MTNEEYQKIQDDLTGLAQMVKMTFTIQGLQEFVSRIETADAVGPVFNPTLWMRGHKTMDQIKDLAVGMQHFLEAAHGLDKP